MSTLSSTPLLYSYRRCPYAMRARMAMLQARRAFRVVDISLRDKPAAMLALSPKGSVPVLQLPGGQVLDESLDIMRWALTPEDRDGCWHRAQSPENLALLHSNDGDFKLHLDRYKYPDRYPGETRSRDELRSEAAAVLLEPLEARLLRECWLGGDAPCATDLAILPFVRQFAGVEPRWFADQSWPAVQAWLDKWLNSQLFETCMLKLPRGRSVPFPALMD